MRSRSFKPISNSPSSIFLYILIPNSMDLNNLRYLLSMDTLRVGFCLNECAYSVESTLLLVVIQT